MKLSHTVLIESKSARDYGLSEITVRDSQSFLLRKVKEVFFTLWRGVGYMTTKQLAEYYGVPEATIRQNYLRCKAEFDADGAVKVAGEELQDARDKMSLPSKTSQAVVFPPRAVLRMGFILQESEVAAQVRTAALNLIQGAYQFFDPQVLESLIERHPLLQSIVLEPVSGPAKLVVSAPLQPYYSAIERGLKRHYPDGAIPGMSKDDIRKDLASLSTWTASWKLDTRTEMRYDLADSVRGKYPDLTSPVIDVVVDGRVEKSILMFQISEMLIDEIDVEAAIGRQYLKRAKKHFGVDHPLLFLVSPFGATPAAEDYIRRDLPEEMKGRIGVMTVKEVANLLLNQAKQERKHNPLKGEAKRNFERILNYEIPDAPLMFML